MLLSRIHKIWISLFVMASLAMSGVVSATMLSMPMMMTSIPTTELHHSDASETSNQVDCHSLTSQNTSMAQSTDDNSQPHCDKLMASSCCPAVCVNLGLLSPTTQLLVRQPYRCKLSTEASVSVIERPSSLYRPPIS